MWYRYKDRGALHITSAERDMFYSNFKAHEQRESSSRQVDMWLNTHRPVLLQSKMRATEIRKSLRGNSDSSESDGGSVCSGMDSDEQSVESLLADPGEAVLDILE